MNDKTRLVGVLLFIVTLLVTVFIGNWAIDRGPPYDYTVDDVNCIAKAIYYESRGEPVEGQLAVGEVVRNRMLSDKYPNTACEVIAQNHQFEFYEPGMKTSVCEDKYKSTAIQVLEENTNFAKGSMHFVASWLIPKPGWTRKAKESFEIGNHVFYLF